MNTINEPSKLKAEVTYNAAADHFDDGPLAFWDRYGRRTVERLSLSPGSLVLDVGCGGAAALRAMTNGTRTHRSLGKDDPIAIYLFEKERNFIRWNGESESNRAAVGRCTLTRGLCGAAIWFV
jgi:hypothetical protein